MEESDVGPVMSGRRQTPPTRGHAVASREPDALYVRVMRLQRPHFHWDHHPYVEPDEGLNATHGAFPQSVDQSVGETMGLTPELVMPSSFGDIHKGEKFRSYIHVSNISQLAVRNIVLKVYLTLQSTNKNLLLDTREVDSLAVGDAVDLIVVHDRMEEGTYLLGVSVRYLQSNDLPHDIRKLYKFSVMDALEVSYRLWQLGVDTYADVKVRNISKSTFLLDQVCMEARGSMVDLSNPPPLDPTLQPFVPGAIRKFIYRFAGSQSLEKESHLGMLQLGWTGGMGQRGSRQVSISPKPRVPSQLSITLLAAPKEVMLEVPFHLTWAVKNMGKKELTASLITLPQHSRAAVRLVGRSNLTIGPLQPNETQEFTIRLIPFLEGIHGLSGLSILDLSSKQKSDLYHTIRVAHHSPPTAT